MELYFTERKDWRKWLEKNHKSSEEVWLIYYKRPSGKPRIQYNDAVEEALCFGWIDGKIKRINEDYYIQRFTPRRSGSRWSKYNIDRVEKLKKAEFMKPAGLKAYMEALEKPELVYDDRRDGNPSEPEDLMKELKKNKIALRNFQNFTQSSRRMFIDWLNSAKRPETRSKRINRIIELSEKNIKPGMGVI
ncbi:MAG: YdeI/OmpD-associated family protein [Bacteroidia bacterium]|nr:YdeI/OmpD-associated family protein [Bacteroidia bacterium]